LEIAVLLGSDVRVVTDNDGDVLALQEKYADYLTAVHPHIKICYDNNVDCPTLEPQLLKANSRDMLNAILGKAYADDAAFLKFMVGNKTDCALKMFETAEAWVTPGYLANAIE
jgi:putative ATP-dependent endonuclease of OLD family